jgi:hypothetical protein
MALLIPRSVMATVAAVLLVASAARAQDPPPRIPFVALDLHGTLVFFPKNDPQLALSRYLSTEELPGTGLGAHGALTLYPFKWKAVTFGIGADVAVGRSHKSAAVVGDAPYRAVTETFAHAAPELSFNFGNGNGWSYFSGGIGPSVWSLTPDEGGVTLGANTERLKTINYGGGARWFMKRHMAFSLDVRFYAINPSTPDPGLPAGPRTRLLVMGAGLSFK